MWYEWHAKLFKALAHPFRLRLLGVLSGGAAYVGRLVAIANRPQSYVSQHLYVLRMAGLVTAERTRGYASY
jgi:ArsR family transcriptional regulator